MVIGQAVHAPQQKGLPPVVETGGAEPPAFTWCQDTFAKVASNLSFT
jgi:hypothetical protein